MESLCIMNHDESVEQSQGRHINQRHAGDDEEDGEQEDDGEETGRTGTGNRRTIDDTEQNTDRSKGQRWKDLSSRERGALLQWLMQRLRPSSSAIAVVKHS